ncbi:MAG: FliH/SctL family protein [Pseudomonadota bacterium]|nr:FliH/SctL family protein [Pseudomonadota bacterium]
MPSSKNFIRSQNTPSKVVDFKPQKFPVRVPEAAEKFVRFDSGPTSSFKINELVSQQIGVTEKERQVLEKKVQDLVLVEVQKVEKEAYREAYDLGLDVGRKEAFDKYIEQYKSQFTRISELVSTLCDLSQKLISSNEGRIVDLIFYISQRLAMDHIKTEKEVIIKVLKSVFENIQKDEHTTVKISDSDFEFIEEVRARMGEELKFLEGHKLEASKEIKKGGCRVETNYGVIDATVEERLSRVWNELQERSPNVDDIVKKDGN